MQYRVPGYLPAQNVSHGHSSSNKLKPFTTLHECLSGTSYFLSSITGKDLLWNALLYINWFFNSFICHKFPCSFISHKSSAFADWYSSTITRFSFRPSDAFSESSHFLFLKLDCIFCHSSVSFLDPDAGQLHLQNVCPKKEPCLARLRFLTPASLRISVYHLYFFLRNQLRTYFICRKYHLESGQYTLAELTSLCNELTDQLNALSDSLDRDSDGLADMGKDLQDRARAAMFSLGTTYPELSGYYPQPKGLLFPAFLSVQNLSGIYSPLPLRQTITPQWFPTIFHLPSVTNFRICVDLCRRKKQILSVFSPV